MANRPRQSVVTNEDLSVFSSREFVQEPPEQVQPLNLSFALKIDSCRVLFSLLQSLYSSGSSNSRVQQHANLSANAKGLRVSTENVARSVFGRKRPVLLARYNKMAPDSKRAIGLPSGPLGSTMAGILLLGLIAKNSLVN